MIRALAPAKLNLFLHIVGRRADGYHLLQTLFQYITLYDVLTFNLRDDGVITCRSDAINLAPEQDLVYRAARLLQQQYGVFLGADIQVSKHIPMGGGLGGGSSDAASTLLALNKLWSLNLNRQSLADLGIQLGADVPVFIFAHSAWAEGVGETLQRVKYLPTPWYVVIYPAVHVNTAHVFQHPNLPRDTQSINMPHSLTETGSSHVDIVEYLDLGNDCQSLLQGLYPEVDAALTYLNQYATAHLTGTGACVFAAFTDKIQTEAVILNNPNPAWKIEIVQGLNQSPNLKILNNM